MNTDDVVAVDKAHLDIDLRKFRLSVGPRVFIAEAPHYLEVFVDAAYHQNLFK